MKGTEFLLNYFKDPKQFVGPHFAKTFTYVLEIEKEIQEAYKDINVPVHLTEPDRDSVCSNEAMHDFMN